MKNFDWKSLLRYESGSVLMIVFGVLLTVKPDFASAAVSAVLGWVLILGGVALLLAGFVGKMGIGPIAGGALLLIAGTWFHRNPLMIASVIGTLLGILVLTQGIHAMKDAQRTKRGGGFWIMGAVLAVLEVVIGIRLILSPLSVSRLVLSVVGIIMAICGACNLVAHNRSRRYIPDSDGIIDADE